MGSANRVLLFPSGPARRAAAMLACVWAASGIATGCLKFGSDTNAGDAGMPGDEDNEDFSGNDTSPVPDDQPPQNCVPGENSLAPDDNLTGTFSIAAHLEIQEPLAELIPYNDRTSDLNLVVHINQEGTIKDGDATLTGLVIETSSPDWSAAFDVPAAVDPKTGEFIATIAEFLVPEGFNDQLCGDNTAAVTLNGFMRNHDCVDGMATVHFADAKASVLTCSPVEIEFKGDFAGQRNRSAANGTATWTDPISGLIWQNPPAGSVMTWDKANLYCASLSPLDGGGWRLPDIDELRTLIRGCAATETGGSCNIEAAGCLDGVCRDGPCDGCPFREGPTSGCYWPNGLEGSCGAFWSSSSFADSPSDAWYVDFSYGNVNDYYKTYAYYARCVRGGP